MRALRFALLTALASALLAACATPRAGREPQAVGPIIGESTARGPADSTRPVAALVPGGVPEDVGPGMKITAPGPGAPPPTTAPTAVAEERPVLVLPLDDLPPPPVFQPPPPPPAPDLSDQVFTDEEG